MASSRGRLSQFELRWWSAAYLQEGEQQVRARRHRPAGEPLYQFLRGARVRSRLVGCDLLIDGVNLSDRLNALCDTPCYDAARGLWNMLPLLERWTAARRYMFVAEVRRFMGDIGNAMTWPFPVQYKVVRGATPAQMVSLGEAQVLDVYVSIRSPV